MPAVAGAGLAALRVGDAARLRRPLVEDVGQELVGVLVIRNEQDVRPPTPDRGTARRPLELRVTPDVIVASVMAMNRSVTISRPSTGLLPIGTWMRAGDPERRDRELRTDRALRDAHLAERPGRVAAPPSGGSPRPTRAPRGGESRSDRRTR